MHVQSHACTVTYTCTHIHNHTCTHNYMHVHSHIHMYTHMYTCMYTHSHILYIHIRTCNRHITSFSGGRLDCLVGGKKTRTSLLWWVWTKGHTLTVESPNPGWFHPNTEYPSVIKKQKPNAFPSMRDKETKNPHNKPHKYPSIRRAQKPQNPSKLCQVFWGF